MQPNSANVKQNGKVRLLIAGVTRHSLIFLRDLAEEPKLEVAGFIVLMAN